MGLDLGTLTGYLEMDDSKFSGVLDRLPEKLKGSGKVLGLAAGVVGVGISAALAGGLEQALDMQDAGAKLGAQLGLTAKESARYGTLAGKLYSQNYGESVEDVSAAVGNVVSSIKGMKTASDTTVEAMTAKFLNFNSTFEVDTQRSTQVVGQMLSSGLVKTANEGVDLLTRAFQKVPSNVREDLLDASDEYSPFFKQLGLTGAQSMGLLVNASAKGAFGIDKTGDALKEFTIRSTDMSTASGAGYKLLGMNQQKMTDALLKGGPTARNAFSQITKGLQGIKDPAKQSQAALALFGTPLEDLGTGGIPKFLDGLTKGKGAMDGAAGSADKMGKAINGTAGASLETVRRQFLSIVGTVGQQLLPVLTAVLDWAMKNPEVMQYAAIGLGVLAVAFGVVTAAMWAMSLTPIALIIGGIVLAVAALVVGIVLLATHWSEITAWITGVWSGFVGWLTGVMNGLAGWWSGVWQGILGLARGVWAAIVGYVSGQIRMALTIISTVLGAIRAVWSAGWNFLFAVNRAILGAIVGYVRGQIMMVLTIVSAVIAGARAVWSAGWNAMRSVASAVAAGIQAIVRGLHNGVKAGIDAVVGVFRNAKAGITAIFSNAIGMLSGIGGQIVAGLKNGISNAWGSVTSLISGLTDKLPKIVKKALGIASPSKVFKALGRFVVQGFALGITGSQSQIKSAMTSMANKVVDAYNTIVTKQVLVKAGTKTSAAVYKTVSNRLISAAESSAAQKLIKKGNGQLLDLAKKRDAIAKQLTDAKKALADKVKESATYQAGFKDKIIDSVNTVQTSSVGELVSSLKTRLAQSKLLTATLGRLKKLGLDKTTYAQLAEGGLDSIPIAQALLQGGKGAVSQVGSLQKQLGSAAGGLASSTAKQLYGAGINAAQGLVDGLKSKETAIEKQMSKIAKTLVRSIKRALGIKSPSRVLRDVGINTGDGLLVGLREMQPAIDSQMARMVTPPSPADLSAAGAFASNGQRGDITSTAELIIHGNVGWDADEVARQMAEKQRQALALANVTMIGVAG